MASQTPFTNLDPSQRIVMAAEQTVARCVEAFRATPSPRAIYAARVSAIDVTIKQAFGNLSLTSNPQEVMRLQSEIVSLGRKLSELERDFKATAAAEEVAYQQRREFLLENLCSELISALGIELVKKKLQDLPADEDSTSRGASSRQLPGVHAGQQPTPSVSGKDSAADGEGHESATGRDDGPAPKTEDATSNKRTRDDQDSPQRQSKRQRTGAARHGRKTIEFDQVFGKGSAQPKRMIVQHPQKRGQWYIIRCEEHDLEFEDKPLVTAGSHIGSAQHGQKRKEASVVIEHFGIRVLNCDEELAEENNAVARAWFGSRRKLKGKRKQIPPDDDDDDDESSSELKHGRNTTRDSRASATSQDGRKQGTNGPVLDPTPGKVYLGTWGKTKKRWAVLILPETNLSSIGIPGTLESLRLMEKVPACYERSGKAVGLTWAEGYEDGGPLVANREFPVMYFDGRPFPDESSVGWLGAKSLMHFDARSDDTINTPHVEVVRKYLDRRAGESSTNNDAYTVPSSAENTDDETPSQRSTSVVSLGKEPDSPYKPVDDKPGPPTFEAAPTRVLDELDGRPMVSQEIADTAAEDRLERPLAASENQVPASNNSSRHASEEGSKTRHRSETSHPDITPESSPSMQLLDTSTHQSELPRPTEPSPSLASLEQDKPNDYSIKHSYLMDVARFTVDRQVAATEGSDPDAPHEPRERTNSTAALSSSASTARASQERHSKSVTNTPQAQSYLSQAPAVESLSLPRVAASSTQLTTRPNTSIPSDPQSSKTHVYGFMDGQLSMREREYVKTPRQAQQLPKLPASLPSGDWYSIQSTKNGQKASSNAWADMPMTLPPIRHRSHENIPSWNAVNASLREATSTGGVPPRTTSLDRGSGTAGNISINQNQGGVTQGKSQTFARPAPGFVPSPSASQLENAFDEQRLWPYPMPPRVSSMLVDYQKLRGWPLGHAGFMRGAQGEIYCPLCPDGKKFYVRPGNLYAHLRTH